MIVGIAVVVGIGLAVAWFLVLAVCAMLGIPIESRAKRERRAQIAAQMQAQAINDEARRNLAVRDAEQRLAGEG